MSPARTKEVREAAKEVERLLARDCYGQFQYKDTMSDSHPVTVTAETIYRVSRLLTLIGGN